MPWPPKQRAAIAADLARKGKSRAQISRFFHEHGHGGRMLARHMGKGKRGRR